MNIIQFSEDLGKMVVVFAGVLLSIASVMFFLNISISNAQIVLAFLITIILFYKYYKSNHKSPVRNLLIITGLFLFIFLSSILLSGHFYDLSWDGQAYQQEAIIQLDQGWNPHLDNPLSDKVNRAIWINHYAKGPWILAATIYHLNNHIEQGKAFNLLLIISVFLISLSVLNPFFKKRGTCFLFSFLLAFNPVSVYQMFSYYVDGLLSSLLILFFLLAILYIRHPHWLNLITIAATIVFIVNIKFTALVYIAVLSFAFFLYIFINQREKIKPVFITLAAAFILSVAVIGFNPYITNTVKNGHPFYPLAGKNPVDIITINMDKKFVTENNRFKKFIKSTFSPSDNSRAYPMFKSPFVITENEMYQFSVPDTRIGGFGPLSGIIALLSAALFVYLMFVLEVKQRIWLSFVVFWLSVSIFINPEPWWARYIPQLWIIPVLLIFLSLLFSQKRFYRIIPYGLAVILAANILITGGFNIYSSYVYSKITDQELSEVALLSKKHPVDVTFGAFASNRIRLKESNIHYREVKNFYCHNSATFIRSYLQVCLKNKQDAVSLNKILEKRLIVDKFEHKEK